MRTVQGVYASHSTRSYPLSIRSSSSISFQCRSDLIQRLSAIWRCRQNFHGSSPLCTRTGRGRRPKSAFRVSAAVSSFDEPWQGSNDVFESMEEVCTWYSMSLLLRTQISLNCNIVNLLLQMWSMACSSSWARGVEGLILILNPGTLPW